MRKAGTRKNVVAKSLLPMEGASKTKPVADIPKVFRIDKIFDGNALILEETSSSEYQYTISAELDLIIKDRFNNDPLARKILTDLAISNRAPTDDERKQFIIEHFNSMERQDKLYIGRMLLARGYGNELVACGEDDTVVNLDNIPPDIIGNIYLFCFSKIHPHRMKYI